MGIRNIAAATFIILAPFQIGATPTPASTAVRVNADTISNQEISALSLPGESRAVTTERAILYRLAVQAARAASLDRDPSVREKIDRALYEGFLAKKVADSGQKLNPSSDEVRMRYENMPLLRLRQLVLLQSNPRTPVSEAAIHRELDRGTDFKKLVIRYSQDRTPSVAGDLDFRGVDALPSFAYDATRARATGEIVGPLVAEGAIHWFQITDRKAFAEVPATYLELVTAKLRAEKIQSFLKKELLSLKASANIEMAEGK